jgi:ParB family chromosome partitioning protein
MRKSQQQRLQELADLGAEGDAPAKQRIATPAPIQMMEFKAAPDSSKQERLEGVHRRATTVRQISATTVRRSKYANRHPDEFKTPEYLELAADIKATGGNQVPGKVRRLHGAEEGGFEIIFGHRRHQACLDHGLPFLAEICDSDNRTLFEEMTRENLFRKDPSPWDWGQHYAAGLRDVYATQDELCAANGKSKGHVSMALQIAELPAEVVEAFASPLQIQLAWGPAMQEALRTNREGVLKRAAALKGSTKSATQVFRELAGNREQRARVADLKVHGREVGSVAMKGGAITVKLKKRTLEADQLHEFRKLIEDFLASRVAK